MCDILEYNCIKGKKHSFSVCVHVCANGSLDEEVAHEKFSFVVNCLMFLMLWKIQNITGVDGYKVSKLLNVRG